MKQLLTILLLFPLFISCSSDDDDKNTMTDTEKEAFLVGRWSNDVQKGKYTYFFYSDKTYKKYEINKIYQGSTIVFLKLVNTADSIGVYSVKDNQIHINKSIDNLDIKNNKIITIGNADYYRDSFNLDGFKYEIVE